MTPLSSTIYSGRGHQRFLWFSREEARYELTTELHAPARPRLSLGNSVQDLGHDAVLAKLGVDVGGKATEFHDL